MNRAGVVNPGAMLGAYAGGGPVEDYDTEDTDGTEQQGADDATLDPLALIQSAMAYGQRKLGMRAGDNVDDADAQPAMADGGVVPTGDDTGDGMSGDPSAVVPRAAMEYLSGEGAVSPEIAQALEQRVDPSGQLNPTQRAMTAIGVAPNDEARFGLLQHYRTRYNARSGAAKAALARGNLGEAARQATAAMDSVPDGQHTQFAPAQGGLAMASRPAFNWQGQQSQQQSQQQSFEDGGEVDEVPADAPTEEYPAPVAMTDTEAADAPPVEQSVAPDAPRVIAPQELVRMLDEGFDKKIDARLEFTGSEASPTPEPLDPNHVTPGSVMTRALPNALGIRQLSDKLGDAGSAIGGALSKSAIGQWYGAEPPAPPAPTTGSEASTRGPPAPPAPTTGSEASTRGPENADGTPPVTAPVTDPDVAAAAKPAAPALRGAAPSADPRTAPRAAGSLPRVSYGAPPSATPQGSGFIPRSASAISGIGPQGDQQGVVPSRRPSGDMEARRRAAGARPDRSGSPFFEARENDDQYMPSLAEFRQKGRQEPRQGNESPAEYRARTGLVSGNMTSDQYRAMQGQKPVVESPADRAKREAGQIYGWTSQGKQRSAYATKYLADERENQATSAKEDRKDDRADRRNESGIVKQGVINEAAGRRQSERLAATASENEKKQASQARLAQINNMAKGLLSENNQKAALLREAIRSNPRLIDDAFGLQKKLGPLFPGLSINELKEVGRAALDNMSFGGSTAPRAPAAPSASSNDQAADRNLRPGQVVPKVWNGKTYNYTVGDDGNLRLAPR